MPEKSPGMIIAETRLARIAADVSLVAKECGVTPALVRFVWFNATRDGNGVARIGHFGSRRRVGAPRGTDAAMRLGLIVDPKNVNALVWREWVATLTPLGKRILWRIHELSAERRALVP